MHRSQGFLNSFILVADNDLYNIYETEAIPNDYMAFTKVDS